MNPIDLKTISYPDLKALAHDIQFKIIAEQQQLYAVLRLITGELDLRLKALPQEEKDAENATLDNIINQFKK